MESMPVLVTLVVVIVVGVLVVQMFSGQISAKSKEIKSIEKSRTLKNAFDKAKQFCQDKCANALENECNDVVRSQFCMSHIRMGLDMDGNGEVSDYNGELLGAIGVCEDKVYCPQLVECTCRQELTMSTCIALLCNYWRERGIPDVDSALERYLEPGTCDYTNQPFHWYNIEKGSNAKLVCP